MTDPIPAAPRPEPVTHPPGRMGLEHPAPFKVVASWVLYDLANTIYSMGVVSFFFADWLRGSVGEARADGLLGVITSVSMGIIFICSPLIGAMTDRARRRMPFLIASTTLCVICTLLMARVGYVGTIIAFVVGNAAYQAGLQFYDSLLPEVTTEENRGRIGGIGVGVGYFGSFIAIGYGFVISDDFPLLFTLVAFSFLALAIPCFLFVRERGNPNPGRIFDLRFVIASTRQTLQALRASDQFPGLARFLVGRVFYTDAINTVITFMLLVAKNVFNNAGVTGDAAQIETYKVMALAIGLAVIGGFVWGRMVDRIGPKRTLNVVLYLWMGTLVLGSLMGLLALPPIALYIVAAGAGVGMGGVWSADRPLMLRLTPPHRIGEFYGLYGMVGRFSAVIGPLIWAATTVTVVRSMGFDSRVDTNIPITVLMRGQGMAIALLLLMVIVSWWILRKVDDKPRDWQALGSPAA